MSFPPDYFRRYDENPDALFYAQPRFVTHIDDHAIAQVTRLYRDYLPEGGAILDLCSSWISHLPTDRHFRAVIGVGLNAEELAANRQLTDFLVHDLNADPHLPYSEAQFDGGGCCVSIDYLTRPVAVLREVGRVMAPGAPFVITFSNRCFPTKAVAVWHQLPSEGHLALVRAYCEAAGTWRDIELLDASPSRPGADPLYAVVARSTGVWHGNDHD
jgi:SAM-dependent methyltransferase